MANTDNDKLERQLDQYGRNTAVAMGEAIQGLKIPVGETLSSPAYRALETVHYAQLGNPQTYAELGDNGQNMHTAMAAQAEWLRKQSTRFSAGANTFIVTHFPNITRAFPEDSAGLEDGEALVFGPDGNGGAKVVGRIKIEEWPAMLP